MRQSECVNGKESEYMSEKECKCGSVCESK